MSVFTPVSEAELKQFLALYHVGELLSFRGIAEGIENTNFFVETSQGRYVLTLFERTPAQDLPYFLGVMGHLSAAGIASARPIPDRADQVLQHLNGRAAALVERLSGKGVEQPTIAQCAALGRALAQMHLAGADFPLFRENCRAADWWTSVATQLQGKLSSDLEQLLADEMAYQACRNDAVLPRGVIHADLFRDNALFAGDELSGVIDFYYACNDCWLYDLAVCVNDWVINATGEFQAEAYQALVCAYVEVRPITPDEHGVWMDKLRAAALRFWVSRLQDWHFPRAGEMTYLKDPQEFERILRAHRGRMLELPR
jgi:homoserine kinase type II